MATRIPASFCILSKHLLVSRSPAQLPLGLHDRSRLLPRLTSSFNGRQALQNCIRCVSSDERKSNEIEIYNGPLSQRIRTVKLFSLTSSLFGLACQPILLEKVVEEGHSLAVLIFSGAIIQFFTFVTPFLFHYITKRYVRKIYYNEEADEYVALTYSFFAGDKLLNFKAEDVVCPDIPGMFTTWIVKGAPLFIDASHFEYLDHYKRLMGFDKPIDFKLDDKPTKE